MTAPAATRMTTDEFLAMDDAGFELVDGELVEVPMSAISALVAHNLAVASGRFVREARLGFWFPQDTALSCWPGRPNHFQEARRDVLRERPLPR